MYSSKKLPMTLLPNAPGLKLEGVAIDAETVSVSVESICQSASCPICGMRRPSNTGRKRSGLL